MSSDNKILMYLLACLLAWFSSPFLAFVHLNYLWAWLFFVFFFLILQLHEFLFLCFSHIRLDLKDCVHIVLYITVIIKINKYLSCLFRKINKLLKAKRLARFRLTRSVSVIYMKPLWSDAPLKSKDPQVNSLWEFSVCFYILPSIFY